MTWCSWGQCDLGDDDSSGSCSKYVTLTLIVEKKEKEIIICGRSKQNTTAETWHNYVMTMTVKFMPFWNIALLYNVLTNTQQTHVRIDTHTRTEHALFLDLTSESINNNDKSSNKIYLSLKRVRKSCRIFFIVTFFTYSVFLLSFIILRTVLFHARN